MSEGIDWDFVDEITRQVERWPVSKTEEWNRLRYPNGIKPEDSDKE